MSWSLHSPLSLIVKLESYILPIYLSLGVVFCCFGLLHKQTNNQIFIPQAFEANASSSGGTQTLIEWNFNQDYKTIKKWKWYIKKRKVEFWLQLSNKLNWDNDSFELCWIIQILSGWKKNISSKRLLNQYLGEKVLHINELLDTCWI